VTAQNGLFPTTAAKFTAVAAALCALVVGGVLGVVVRGNDDGTKVVLEPITKVARDSWIKGGIDTDTGHEAELGEQYAAYRPSDDVPDSRQSQITATLAGEVVNGGSAGIYGGSRDTQVCDKQRLSDFLTDPANAAVAKAWAGVLGMEASQISNYIEGLTGVRLRWDTRVTDSGIRRDKVYQWQALLQAGTAVLVDNTGVPRVRCASGGPLLGSEGLRSTSNHDMSISDVAQNPSDAWAGLDPDNTVAIQPGTDPLQTVTLIDVDSDDLLQRDVGSDGASSRDVGSGDVQFNLRWNSRADLDLHVVDPDGYKYGYFDDGVSDGYGETGDDHYYDGKSSPNNGEQDVDSNIGCKDERDESGYAKENIFWPPGDAPAGSYTVWVRGFQVGTCSPPQPGDFILTVTVNGKVQTFTGSVGQDDNSQVWTFTKDE